MALVDLNSLCHRIIDCSDCIWKQPVGDRGEPMDSAWRRLFGNPMGDDPPMLIHYTKYEGRDLVIRLHPLGRISVADVAQGHQIRRFKPGLAAAIANANRERQAWNENEAPMVAATTRWLEGSRHVSPRGPALRVSL